MTLSLDKTIANHPGLKEAVELLVQHEDWVLFRTVRRYICGSYEKQRWYITNLSTGESFPVADSPNFGGHLKGAHIYDGELNFHDAESDAIVVDGVEYSATDSRKMVTIAIKSLVESQVSGDEIRKGLESSGVAMNSLYSTNYKLEKNYNGGWKVVTATGDHSVADFLARLAEVTTA